MKHLISLLFFFFANLSLALSQDAKLNIKLDILPQLKDLFKDQEITLTIFLDSPQKRILLNTDTASFTVPQFDSLALFIRSNVYSDTFYKHYSAYYEIKRLKSNSITTVIFKFPIDCQFNIQGTNRKCPKCYKSDKVIPICYGLPMYDENGNTAGPKCYSAGCMVSDCDPSWYCERDKYRF